MQHAGGQPDGAPAGSARARGVTWRDRWGRRVWKKEIEQQQGFRIFTRVRARNPTPETRNPKLSAAARPCSRAPRHVCSARNPEEPATAHLAPEAVSGWSVG